jgi:hypothetical protein
MGRLSTAHKTAMGADVLHLGLFAEFSFESGTSRFWSGASTISWNSVNWNGGALIAGVQMSGEGEELQARRFTFTLNGVDRAYYSVAKNTQYRNRACKLWWNLMNSAGTAVTYSYLVEEARMDTLTVKQSGNTITLVLTAESRLLDLFRPRRALMTPADHKKLFPFDDFYKFVQGLKSGKLPWGLEDSRGSGSQSGPPSGGQEQWKPK